MRHQEQVENQPLLPIAKKDIRNWSDMVARAIAIAGGEPVEYFKMHMVTGCLLVV